MPTTILELLRADSPDRAVIEKMDGYSRVKLCKRWAVLDGDVWSVYCPRIRKEYTGDVLYRGTSEADAVAALLGDTAPVSTPKIGA